MALKLYTNVAKELNLKVRKFWGLALMFIDLAGKKWKESFFATILNSITRTAMIIITVVIEIPKSHFINLKM